jgi:hypothetical protein
MKARNLTRQQQLRLKPEELALPWQVLLAIHSNEAGYRHSTRNVPEGIYDTCLYVFTDSELGFSVWDRLAREHPRLRDAKREMAGPREGRVVFFEEFLVCPSHLWVASYVVFWPAK